MASLVDRLLSAFELVVNEPWSTTLSGQERVWFLVYDPAEQRKIDFRIGDFENTCRKAGKKWACISLKTCFAEWMSNNEYRDAYFEDPESLVDQLETEFKQYAVDYLSQEIIKTNPDHNTLVAIKDVSALFGFARLSEVLNIVSANIQGRMLIFFPGEFENYHYRLLDARDGWSYLARPITA